MDFVKSELLWQSGLFQRRVLTRRLADDLSFAAITAAILMVDYEL
jgi:hypothetical protein